MPRKPKKKLDVPRETVPAVVLTLGTESANGTHMPAEGALSDDWFRDRIREFRRVPAELITPHPKNPRRHGPDQKFAMRGLLEKIGYVDALIVRELPDGHYQLLNGHMRHDLCEGAAALPVLVVDVTEAEADLVLATYDEVGEMALSDEELADELATQVWTDDQSINTILRGMLMFDDHKVPKPAQQQIMDNQLALAPLPYEHYDYVVILARSTMDYDRLCALLKISKENFSSPGGVYRVGIGRCIDAGRFFDIVEHVKL